MKNRLTVLAAVAVALFVPALPALAAPAPAAVRSGLDCYTWVHNNDDLYGGVDCTNNTGAPVTFHADIVCGLAPDVTGNSVTAQPGRTEESSGHCAFYSTGIGHIGWTVE
ncbi:hypothetical protein AB0K51_16090 [Kitasatospora sp. NPDC049285]|uniref:hypothetical protein n=1 Tax=Kitasatospora sp. NPDC049285 TaxID=3157096 RepID=UPI0034443937